MEAKLEEAATAFRIPATDSQVLNAIIIAILELIHFNEKVIGTHRFL